MMSRFTTLILAFYIALSIQGRADQTILDIPKAAWEPDLFKSINSFSEKLKWTSLRSLTLEKGSIEVRVWTANGLMPLKVMRVRKQGDTWNASMALDSQEGEQLSFHHDFVLGPAWNDEWNQITALGLLTLPDSSTLSDEVGVLDGIVAVVEYNDGMHYRTYMYSNPNLQKWPEAKKLLQVVGNLQVALDKRRLELAHNAIMAKQAGTEQPATRSESKSEGSDKPQSGSEGRSR